MNRSGIGSHYGPDCPFNGTIKPPLLVLGGRGDAGPELVSHLLDAGWPIYLVDPRPLELRAQIARAEAGRLSVIEGGIDDDAAAAHLAARLRLLRPLPGAVLSIADSGFPPGRLLDHDGARLRQRLEQDLLPQLAAVRHLLPVLVDSGRPCTWLILGGPASETPWSGYGHVSVSAAALRSLVEVLREETRNLPVRIRQLSVCSPIRSERNRAHACSDWPNPYEVAHRIGELLLSAPEQTVACMRRRAVNPALRRIA